MKNNKGKEFGEATAAFVGLIDTALKESVDSAESFKKKLFVGHRFLWIIFIVNLMCLSVSGIPNLNTKTDFSAGFLAMLFVGIFFIEFNLFLIPILFKKFIGNFTKDFSVFSLVWWLLFLLIGIIAGLIFWVLFIGWLDQLFFDRKIYMLVEPYIFWF